MPSVLVIDDSRLVAQKVQYILDPYGIDTHHAATVAEVFGYKGKPSMLRDYVPDVILLDIMMPDMNGFDTLQKLQSMVKMRNIPVMMFSASASEHNVIEAMHRGAKAFIAKPLDRELLLVEMARVAKESNSRALVRQLSSYLPTGVKAENEREDLNVGEANLSYLLEIIDDDEELLRQLVEVFVEDMPAQISGMENAVTAKKARELSLAAHLFKGSVSNFGAVLITDKALQLEIKGRADDLKGTPALFADLKKDADVLYKQLIAWLAF